MAQQIEPKVLVLMSLIHCNSIAPEKAKPVDVDRLILLAKEFDKRFGRPGWEITDTQMIQAMQKFYSFQFNNPNFK
jgi:hypothetical protein